MHKRFLITGGAGFIGSALVRQTVLAGHQVLNLDKLTYAADLRSLEGVTKRPNYKFCQLDINDSANVAEAVQNFQPDAIFHLAAESHVDRSIDSPLDFVDTNVTGTANLLNVATHYWRTQLDSNPGFRFVQVSTDEVYGSLEETGHFTEDSPYLPNSPYAASKAAADHLAYAWFKTYNFPVIITHCSNNFGPYQHPEKLIPTIIRSALLDKAIPIYGDGKNIRDWLFVDDHVAGLLHTYQHGVSGQQYNFGGNTELTNMEIAHQICAILDQMAPRGDGKPHLTNIRRVKDRPGHDFRYAVDATKAKSKLNWGPSNSFEKLLAGTVKWYLRNEAWWRIKEKSTARLGLETQKLKSD